MYSKVSIIIPVYKVEEYLHRCVNSVLGQTYQNIEVILVDDGSPDQCPLICDQYAFEDTRVKVIHKKNGGLSEARNYGLSEATGEYIMFVDSDDWIHESAVEKLVYRMDADLDADMCCFGLAKTDGKKILPITRDYTISLIEGRDEIVKDICMVLNVKTSAWSKIYRTKFIKENKLQFVIGVINEDSIFVQTAALYANKILFENSILYYLYANMDSISRNIKEQNFTSLFVVLDKVTKVYKEVGCFEKYKQYIYAGWIKSCLYTLVQAAYRLDKKSFNKFYPILRRSQYSLKEYGENICLFSLKMSFMYKLSLCPGLFYYAVNLLKVCGLQMQ